MNKWNDIVDHEAVVRAYSVNGSVIMTSAIFRVSTFKIKKILTTHGVVVSEKHERIVKMHADGASIKEIAKETNVSEKYVVESLPYSRGPRLPLDADDSLRRTRASVNSNVFRKRKREAAENQ